jgi:hypothetical protein
MLAGRKVDVNCRAAGSLPAGDVNVRFRDTVPFAAVVPEDITNESVCPKEALAVTKSAKSGAILKRLLIMMLSIDKVLRPYRARIVPVLSSRVLPWKRLTTEGAQG